MKEGIHPSYKPSKVVCACGNVIETGSTQGDFHIEICAACHPFFTGKQKIMDTAGRIEKFKNRYSAPAAQAKQAAQPEAKKAAAPAPAAKKVEPAENRAAKRAKTGKSKTRTEAAPAEAASEPKAE
jgi:large subunit ribosomal protein L31